MDIIASKTKYIAYLSLGQFGVAIIDFTTPNNSHTKSKINAGY